MDFAQNCGKLMVAIPATASLNPRVRSEMRKMRACAEICPISSISAHPSEILEFTHMIAIHVVSYRDQWIESAKKVRKK